MKFYLDPANQAVVDSLVGSPPLQDLTVEQYRAFLIKVQKHTPLPGVSSEVFHVPFGKKPKIKVFLFKPENTTHRALPVILYLHGGSWVAGNEFTHDSIVRDLVLLTGCAVAFPQYTLAPEAHYPTQQEECLAVLTHLASHGARKGLLTTRFATASDSAGGQLAVAIALLAHSRRLAASLVYQVLFNPATDTAGPLPDDASEIEFFNGPILTVPSLVQDIALYIPDERERDTALASPLRMTEAEAAMLPPTLVVVSSADPLRSQGEALAHLLQRAGVACALVRAEGQVHDSVVLEATRGSPTPRAVMAMAAQALRGALMGEKEEDEEKKKGKVEMQLVEQDTVAKEVGGRRKRRRV